VLVTLENCTGEQVERPGMAMRVAAVLTAHFDADDISFALKKLTVNIDR